MNKKTVIVIVGPTAVGKTNFAIDVAALLNTEIISADSRQCYRQMNIGVAKPSVDQLEKTVHHFVDVYEPDITLNAAVFEKEALAMAQSIFAKNDYAVMVGGTGLYIKAFCEGLDDIPEVDEDGRKEIINNYELRGMEWLQQRVKEIDPVFWEKGERDNPQRLMRALEVKQATGTSIVNYRKQEKKDRPFDIIKVGLELPRALLYERINQRVDEMISLGLLEEVRSLLPLRHLNALKTVGYQELFEYFDGNMSLEKAISEIKKNSRHYAKRQLTWFKKDREVNWFQADVPPQKVLATLLPGKFL